jgi:hypothetical protein
MASLAADVVQPVDPPEVEAGVAARVVLQQRTGQGRLRGGTRPCRRGPARHFGCPFSVARGALFWRGVIRMRRTIGDGWRYDAWGTRSDCGGLQSCRRRSFRWRGSVHDPQRAESLPRPPIPDTDGRPDSDGDGLPNVLDDCPTKPGTGQSGC